MGMYLDYNASTPLDPRVLEKMTDIYKNHYGNADSRTHRYGNDAKKIVEEAREKVAMLLGVPTESICFTSGSTESNNMAVLGLEEYGKRSGRKHIITTAIEHKSILEPCRHLQERGFQIDIVSPHMDGRVHSEDVLERIRPDTLLVSVMHVNNETGTIQPVKEIGDKLKGGDIYFHVDASQSCGKLVEELRDLPCDLLSASAHKMYGPQGVGLLVIRNKNGKRSELQPILYGGGQERGMRPGTLPVALIGGAGEAAMYAGLEYRDNEKKYRANYDTILRILAESGVQYQINGDLRWGIKNTLNISFQGYDSEALMLAMDMEDLGGISNGSACTSHSYAPSYVLEAMGLDEKRVASAVRISWGTERVSGRDLRKMTELIKNWQG